MTTAVAAFLVAFVVGLALNPVARAACRRLGLVDEPDEYRKVHRNPVPLSGGYALLLSFAAPILLLGLFDVDGIEQSLHKEHARLATLAIGVLVAAAMGAVDDALDLRPRYKLLWQLIAATIAYAGGISITVISNPLGDGYVELGLLSFPATALWFLACMNAVNLVDGLDGLAGGVGLFACVTMALVSVLMQQPVNMFLSAALGGALLGFLIYNFHPASVFLGDAGSMTLGFLIGSLSLMGSVKAGTAVALIVPIIALGLPAFDTALAITRRWVHRLPVAAGDKRHVHHVLLARGLSHRGVVLVLYSVCIALGGAALLLTAGNNMIALALLAALGILAFVFIRAFSLLNVQEIRERIHDDMEGKRQEDLAAVEVEKALSRMDALTDVESLWQATCATFPSLDLDRAELELTTGAGPRDLVWWSPDPPEEPSSLDACVLNLPVKRGDERIGLLRLRRTCLKPVRSCGLMLVRRLRDKLAERLASLAPPEKSD